MGNQIPMPLLKKLIEAFPKKPKIEGDELQQESFYALATIDPFFVAILTKAQVIENYLGSDEKLVEMWNNMCTNVHIRACQRWDDMTHDVLDDYENRGRSMAMRSIFLSHG